MRRYIRKVFAIIGKDIAAEIRTNKYDLSISRYKEIEHKEIKYEKPDVIMKRVLELENEIAGDIKEIRNML